MIDEKYRLDQLLEVGGMGAVYRGTHTKLQKPVAIKVLRRELSDQPDMIERFQREAVSASRIGHENIVNVSDLGTAHDGSPFLVMEYLTGETLRDRIHQGGALSIGLACAVAREILAAIAAAHHAGIIHRDLKPENVFLVRGTRGESVKILDFGISRVIEGRGADPGDWRLTATGQVMGTPYYMAPEQAAGRSDIGGAVDVYATGVILYEMLSGAAYTFGDRVSLGVEAVLVAYSAVPELRLRLLGDALSLHLIAAVPVSFTDGEESDPFVAAAGGLGLRYRAHDRLSVRAEAWVSYAGSDRGTTIPALAGAELWF
jgi:serine/threonine protein kinase